MAKFLKRWGPLIGPVLGFLVWTRKEIPLSLFVIVIIYFLLLILFQAIDWRHIRWRSSVTIPEQEQFRVMLLRTHFATVALLIVCPVSAMIFCKTLSAAPVWVDNKSRTVVRKAYSQKEARRVKIDKTNITKEMRIGRDDSNAGTTASKYLHYHEDFVYYDDNVQVLAAVSEDLLSIASNLAALFLPIIGVLILALYLAGLIGGHRFGI